MNTAGGRKRRKWPAVYGHKNKQGQVNAYIVDLGLQEVPGESKKKRIRYFFKTRQEAEARAAHLRIARKNEGLGALMLPAYALDDYEKALSMLAPYGVSLIQAVQSYLDHAGLIEHQACVNDVINELIRNKEKDGRAAAYLDDLRCRLNVFAREFGDRPIHEITTTGIDDWLRALSGNAVTRNGYRRVLSVLFGFAVKRRYARKNLVAEVELATVKTNKPGILSLPEVRALLGTATRDFVPAIVLQLFGGLRPEAEVWRLSWENIDLEERLIDVAHSKNSASHRYVRIEDNLAAWLAPYAHKRGAISLTDEPYFRLMRETRERAAQKLEAENLPASNLREWPTDCLRHCYASYHCGHFRDSRRTSEEMGHSGDLTIFNNHYRSRVKPAEAAAYWALAPAVISVFPGAAAGSEFHAGSGTGVAIPANPLGS